MWHRPSGVDSQLEAGPAGAAREEELELAARVASRRAAAAEAELARVQQVLDATDAKAKELAWQARHHPAASSISWLLLYIWSSEESATIFKMPC